MKHIFFDLLTEKFGINYIDEDLEVHHFYNENNYEEKKKLLML